MNISSILETSSKVTDDRTVPLVMLEVMKEVGEVSERVGALASAHKEGSVEELTNGVADAIIALTDLAFIANNSSALRTDVVLGLAIEKKLGNWIKDKQMRGEFKNE